MIKNLFPPSEEDALRLAGYKKFDILFRGRHQDYFKRLQDELKDKTVAVYITCNFAGLVSKVCADLLFGEGISFKAEDETTQKWLDEFVKKNDLLTILYESALGNSARGDALLRVRWDYRNAGAKAQETILEAANPALFFPEAETDNRRNYKVIDLAYRVPLEEKQDYLRIERHVPGRIENLLYRMDTTADKMQYPVHPVNLIQKFYPDIEPEIDTGLDVIPIFHIPNFRYAEEPWGISDYLDIESLIDELNNRISRISAVLDKHERPKIILPDGVLDAQGQVKAKDLEVIEVADKERSIEPKYLVWDAQLEASFREIDTLLEMLFLFSEISPSIFGKDKAGQVESGKALKLRMLRTLAKINRKKLYFDYAIKQALECAMQMENNQAGLGLKVQKPQIIWQDGLPENIDEVIDQEVKKVTAGIGSKLSAIKIINHLVDDSQAQEELARIEQDQVKAKDVYNFGNITEGH